MIRSRATLVILIAFALAGCVQPTPGSPQALADATAFPDPSWVPPEPVEVAVPTYGVVGAATTRGEAVEYRVGTFEETAVTLVLDGVPLTSEIVLGERTWPIPLEPGRSELLVTLETPTRSWVDVHALVREVATTMVIEFCHWDGGQERTVEQEVWIDVDGRPAAPLYEAEGAVHPDLFSAHDQLRVLEALTGLPVDATYFPDFQGFLLDKIDAQPSAQAEGMPWWSLFVNGQEASQGMSLQPVAAGDLVLWQMTPCA